MSKYLAYAIKYLAYAIKYLAYDKVKNRDFYLCKIEK
jgi:hypothetical protein